MSPCSRTPPRPLGSRGPEGRPGSIGTAATFSFYPSKNLGAFGDGGAITTSDPEVADRARACASTARGTRSPSTELGYNSRLDALQAAILRVQLPHLDRWSEGRRAAAAHYRSAGLGELVSLPRPTAGADPAWHLYVVRTPEPDALAAALRSRDIGARGLLPRTHPPAAADARVRPRS